MNHPSPYRYTLWADTETKSVNPIAHGPYVYAEAPSELLLFIYALGDEQVRIWDRAAGEPMPRDLHEYMASPEVELAFHNSEFDRTQLQVWPWARQYNLHPMRFRCTMTQARMAGMPGALGDLCKALGLPDTVSKKDGNALIRLFCVPQADGHFVSPFAQPEEWMKFRDYGRDDVVAMRECMRRLPNLFDGPERTYYAYTQIMNDRGIPIDRQLAVAAAVQSERLKKQYRKAGIELSGDFRVGEKEREFNISSQQAILAFLSSYGVKLEDARANTIEKFIDSPQAELLPPTVLQVLSLRLKSAKAATTKFAAILKGANTDDRVRGTIGFYGAARTGRDAGRRVQPQNLARPAYVGTEGDWKKGYEGLDMEKAVWIVKHGLAEFQFEQPLQLMSDVVRGTICPSPGNKFCVADLSNIEGRKLVWLTQESWKLQYFRDFDAGLVKYDNYQVAYARSFNVDPSEAKGQKRQMGKTLELACGYEGGVGAFITFAAVYRMDLGDVGRAVRESAEPGAWHECWQMYDWFKEKGLTYGLDQEAFTGCWYLVRAWRAAHPETKRGWANAAEAFRNAIRNPGISFTGAHKTLVTNVHGWIFVTLPSGRNLVYPHAFEMEGPRGHTQLAFWGVNPFNRKFGVNKTYSGRLIENWTQASSRDVMMYRVPEIEQAGYPIVMRVHDELVAETPRTPQFSGHYLAQRMSAPLPWAPGLPLAAVGEDLDRYQK